ncbi:hypothetical protein L202_06081 [Cryptococcus amylolentus CBS 6039]|uniref:Uncharacterized protein n=1 Tax=Cryptococcus amylolentus CBS 6039 TaxID=1295533 RepID=A0A1E3HIH9_9TREE|nr:hypothetical protein L202_06081 [Cryptococcus amylolentus CBS 6039]ODN76162.1 hypothetical protein L202_06081 [Cryptococcus amylolentus CBS 6039]
MQSNNQGRELQPKGLTGRMFRKGMRQASYTQIKPTVPGGDPAPSTGSVAPKLEDEKEGVKAGDQEREEEKEGVKVGDQESEDEKDKKGDLTTKADDSLVHLEDTPWPEAHPEVMALMTQLANVQQQFAEYVKEQHTTAPTPAHPPPGAPGL